MPARRSPGLKSIQQRNRRGYFLVRSCFVFLTFSVIAIACAKPKPAQIPAVKVVVHDTVTVRDPELDKRVSRLELQLLARDAQIEDLQVRLEDTRAEVVRAMAKLQTVASRAQAASAMAEAEVALQTMKTGVSAEPPEAAQVTRLVRQSATEFDKANYGGALYLANQAKIVSSGYRGRLGVSREGARPGETLFAVPIKLKTTSRGNIREGPGTSFSVSFTAEAGTSLIASSYADEWVRVSDDSARTGWIHQSLIARP
ncbi:MAG TPA: SH3 domain-containing protein [Gemmatimonadaceae bacterium]|nr:SH3 domain-containing protein [Gemmatimonadaceae bacterium]